MMYPKFDLEFSSWFYRAEQGFVYQSATWVRFLYRVFDLLHFPILLFLVLGLLASRVNLYWRRQRSACWFLLLVLLLGPGVMINEVLKNNWGRARPVAIVEFGGASSYTPPWQISDQCQKNCAMASGHAALGYYPIALAWVLRRHRRWCMGLGLGCGSLVGLGRILQGAHFLSDVLVSAAVVWATCALLGRWLLPRQSAQ